MKLHLSSVQLTEGAFGCDINTRRMNTANDNVTTNVEQFSKSRIRYALYIISHIVSFFHLYHPRKRGLTCTEDG